MPDLNVTGQPRHCAAGGEGAARLVWCASLGRRRLTRATSAAPFGTCASSPASPRWTRVRLFSPPLQRGDGMPSRRAPLQAQMDCWLDRSEENHCTLICRSGPSSRLRHEQSSPTRVPRPAPPASPRQAGNRAKANGTAARLWIYALAAASIRPHFKRPDPDPMSGLPTPTIRRESKRLTPLRFIRPMGNDVVSKGQVAGRATVRSCWWSGSTIGSRPRSTTLHRRHGWG